MASDSKNQLIQRPNSENSQISKKNPVNLFPKQADCSYVSCYCEENVYKLSQDVSSRHPNEIHKCFVVFVSNPSRTVPLWRQRAGKDEDRLVIWDYHVIFLYHPEPEKCLVYDLDSELPFPTYVHKYVTETFRTDHILKPDYFRYFRVIPACEFLKEFSSDRRHMKRPDGTWIKPPPNYPAIQTSSNAHNLEDYIQMDMNKDTSIHRTAQDAGPKLSSNVAKTKAEREKERERKIGHRRVGVGGEITYKKIQTSQIMGSIQLGIQHAVGGLASKPERDLLMQDFMTVETTNFPSEGSNHTPAHHFSEFKFKNYAPIAFRYFRDLFGIQPDDFLMSMCDSPLRELSNPGASGSIFYLTSDDEFIIKTVQHKEGEFLQKLLPGYYMNLNQNPRTLLPKFFGLYCYQCNSKNVRLVIMNNLLPSSVVMHQKYDLKGSTYKRKASKAESQKRFPTYKDLDFMEHHPEGILMEADTYNALIKTIQRDCRVLESFKIMDYSLLLTIHNLDQAQREKLEKRSRTNLEEVPEEGTLSDPSGVLIHTEREREKEDRIGAAALNRSRSINRQRLVAHSTAMESIQADSEPIDEDEDVPPGGIPARNAKGERLLLYIGIIDILQSYRLKKKLEHTWKSMIHDGDTVSVHRPSFYAQRFQKFMAEKVFKKIPSPLKHSPSKRKSLSRPLRPHEELDSNSVAPSCCSTPPPTFDEVLEQRASVPLEGVPSSTPARVRVGSHHSHHHVTTVKNYRDDVVSITDIKLESRAETKSSLSVESGSSGAGHSSHSRGLAWTPPASVEGSTPTWTEGTPSFTESSSSGDMGCPTTPLRQSSNTSMKAGHHKQTVEHAINCLTSEMTHL